MPHGLPSAYTPTSCHLYEGIDYQDYWTSRATVKFDLLEHAILRELLPSHGKHLLDLGCGYGRLADCYMDRFESSVLFDGSRSLLEAAQKITNGRAHYVWGNINHLPFRASTFDCILLVRVFQHLPDSRGCIESASKILCQGGYFIFNYCNNRNIHRILKYVLGTIRQNPFTTETQQVAANFFHHHPEYISSLLSAYGFETLTCRGAGVLNKIMESAGFFANLIPPGVFLAPFLGKSLLAPWIFCQTRIQSSATLQAIPNMAAWLVCPCCGLDIDPSTHGFECRNCRRIYPVEGGIIDMRIE